MSTPELIAQIRNYLDITWADQPGDEKLMGIIERGIAYVNRIAGREQDFEAPGLAQSLLYNYCRYDRANMIEDFAVNYRDEINSLQMDEGVAMYEEAQSANAVV